LKQIKSSSNKQNNVIENRKTCTYFTAKQIEIVKNKRLAPQQDKN